MIFRITRAHAMNLQRMGNVPSAIILLLLCFTLPTILTQRNTVTVLFFQDTCRFQVTDVLNITEQEQATGCNFSFETSCEKDHDKLQDIFSNATFNVFVGPMSYKFEMELLKYAEINKRNYISPFSSLLHFDNGKIFSLGASFQQTSAALKVILTHFKWKHVLIIAEFGEYWMQMGQSTFITLSEADFDPTMKIIQKDSTDDDIENVVARIRNSQKAVALCVDESLRNRILVLAAQQNIGEQHAFFVYTKSPFQSLEGDGFEHIADEYKHILHSVFEIHPVFKRTQTRTRRTAQLLNRRDTTVINNMHGVTEHSSLDRNKRSNAADDNISIETEIHYVRDVAKLLEEVFSSIKTEVISNTTDIFEVLKNSTVRTISGDLITDERNDILFDFLLLDFIRSDMKYMAVQELIRLPNGNLQLQQIAEIQWPNGVVLGPDECFYPDDCTVDPGLDALYILAIAIAVLFVAGVATAVIITVWRKVIHKEMSRGHHKIILTNLDLVFLQRKDVMKGSKIINGNITEKPDILKASERPNRSLASLHEYSDLTDTARYNGDLVHVKELNVKGFEMKSKVLQNIKSLREIRHENVNAFIGFFDDPQKPATVTDYCSRGSLEDVLENLDIKLDWDFKVSLLTDLIRGVRFIHNSAIRCHGNLKSRNCVIDSRWVLKVTDFGLAGLCEAAKVTPVFTDKDLLWTSPEHLRHICPPLKGSEKGDVYSISIIMQSVILRSQPYSSSGLTPKEIIHKLKHPPPLLRPSVTHGAAPPQYIQIMKVCWSENPDLRPPIEEIYQQFKTITGGKKMNIVDTMFRMLEKYSTDLEDLVKDRTLQLEEEKKKTDVLLYRMLPPIVADSLKVGEQVAAETFSEVTIYFSDIVGFTTISANSTPMQVVDLLNGLYTMFDATIDSYDVYKVETIGDAYMVSSGLPIRNGNRHAGEISTMALDLLSQCGNFTIKHMPEVPLRVRIGLHSGSCVAGVVGLTMPRYCLFGDTVNTASRMESSGAAYRIHISQEVKKVLDVLGGYHMDYRGEVELKGKGMAKTYWLTGKDGFTKELPEPAPLTGLSLNEFAGGNGKKPEKNISRKESNSGNKGDSNIKHTKQLTVKDAIPKSPIYQTSDSEDIDNGKSHEKSGDYAKQGAKYVKNSQSNFSPAHGHNSVLAGGGSAHHHVRKMKSSPARSRHISDNSIVASPVTVHSPYSTGESTIADDECDQFNDITIGKHKARLKKKPGGVARTCSTGMFQMAGNANDRRRKLSSKSLNDGAAIRISFEESLV